jgi:hypothetical protein
MQLSHNARTICGVLLIRLVAIQMILPILNDERVEVPFRAAVWAYGTGCAVDVFRVEVVKIQVK